MNVFQKGGGTLMEISGLIGVITLIFVCIKINMKLNGKGKYTNE